MINIGNKIGKIIFRQLFDRNSCTYTYMLACSKTKDCLLIDPVKTLVQRDLQLIQQLNLKLKYVLNTHVHADHVTASGDIKKIQPNVKSIISKYSGANADILLKHNDHIKFGSNHYLTAISTPGHTSGCISYFFPETPCVFTGDTLLIRGCGRTDFQQGNPGQLYDSVHKNLFTLPDECLVYPGHDYNGNLCSSIEEEKRFNPRLTKSREEFIELMRNLKLEMPKMIDASLAQNMVCGI